MSKKNNVAAVNHVTLQQIRNDKKTMSITAIARKYGIGYAAAKNACESKSLSEFKRRMISYNANEAKAAAARRKAKKNNEGAKQKAAEKVADLGYAYTPAQVKQKIDQLQKHAANLEERLQTVVSLLIESDDNVVSRIYRLEKRKGFIRRFLERF